MLLGIKARKCVTLITIFSFYPSSETYLTLGCRDSSLMRLVRREALTSLSPATASSLSKGIPRYSQGILKMQAYSRSTLGPPPQDMPRTPCPREAQKAS